MSYWGFYGNGQQVRVEANVKTFRTDDYMRTFQYFEYEFCSALLNQEGGLFKFGNSTWPTLSVVYGNADGKLGEFTFPPGYRKGEPAADRLRLSGPSPWWIAFPESGEIPSPGKAWGQGSRALIIRGYEAEFNGKKVDAPSIPSITLPVKSVNQRTGSRIAITQTICRIMKP